MRDERLENSPLNRRWNSRAIVFHRKMAGGILGPHADFNTRLRRGLQGLARIGDQILQDALHPERVDLDLRRFGLIEKLDSARRKIFLLQSPEIIEKFTRGGAPKRQLGFA